MILIRGEILNSNKPVELAFALLSILEGWMVLATA
jgi:hypothetical protein